MSNKYHLVVDHYYDETQYQLHRDILVYACGKDSSTSYAWRYEKGPPNRLLCASCRREMERMKHRTGCH